MGSPSKCPSSPSITPSHGCRGTLRHRAEGAAHSCTGCVPAPGREEQQAGPGAPASLVSLRAEASSGRCSPGAGPGAQPRLGDVRFQCLQHCGVRAPRGALNPSWAAPEQAPLILEGKPLLSSPLRLLVPSSLILKQQLYLFSFWVYVEVGVERDTVSNLKTPLPELGENVCISRSRTRVASEPPQRVLRTVYILKTITSRLLDSLLVSNEVFRCCFHLTV